MTNNTMGIPVTIEIENYNTDGSLGLNKNQCLMCPQEIKQIKILQDIIKAQQEQLEVLLKVIHDVKKLTKVINDYERE